MTSKIFCAIDTTDPEKAAQLVAQVSPHLGGIKLGMEFFYALGQEGVHRVLQDAAENTGFFLDLKLHDIPNTVASAVKAISPLKPDFLTVHAGGGKAMVTAAVDAAKTHTPSMTILAVTVLTHMTAQDLQQTGSSNDTETQVLRLAETALEAGAGGLVCSPLEISALRQRFGSAPVLMVPGIRPKENSVTQDDQSRTMSPEEAFLAGASHLVIGRPITQAADPAATAAKIATAIPSCTAAA
ncbi:MAG: orotidine-5'-phosphate decarboxylase [Alphaproteobacteria bacterium]|nr:MAG: orotidine-5'-phosphate decarboxylase [Alphaproteobacteria bacterium]